MHLQKLLNTFQDAAEDHASSLGVGMELLEPRGLAWVLVQLHLEFARLPFCGEQYIVHTWPSAANRLYAWRQFQVMVEEKCITRGVSVWIVADMHKRRAARMPQEVQALEPPDMPQSEIFELGKDPSKLPLPGMDTDGVSIPLRLADLDRNGHVNNAVLCQWLYERAFHSMKRKCSQELAPSSLNVRFRKEITPGQHPVCVSSLPQENGGQMLCNSALYSAGELSAAAQITCRSREEASL